MIDVKPFKSYLGQDAVYNFIKSMIDQSKYCTEIIKKHFNKKLVMTREDDEDFKTSTKCWTCDNADGDFKSRYRCHITGKY